MKIAVEFLNICPMMNLGNGGHLKEKTQWNTSLKFCLLHALF